MVSSLYYVLEPTSSYKMIVEALQLWNRATNEDYKRLMEGAMTKMNTSRTPLISSRIKSMKKALNCT